MAANQLEYDIKIETDDHPNALHGFQALECQQNDVKLKSRRSSVLGEILNQ